MKTLKIFLAIVSIIIPIAANACGGWDIQWDNQDLFLLEKPLYADNGFETYKNSSEEESLNFWYNYINKGMSKESLKDAIWYMDESDIKDRNTENKLIKYLRSKGDNAALNFLRLNILLNNKIDYREQWVYNKNNQSVDYTDILNEISRLQTPDKLTPRVHFLKMRCLYAMKRYNECINLWNSIKTDDVTKGVNRRIYGYLGAAYLKQKNYKEALKIYYELGDNLSIHKCVDALMSKGGMDILQKEDVNSLTIRYMAQNYANYYYHYRRNLESSRGYGYELELTDGGAWSIVARDYDQVVALAKNIANDSRTENKMFWNAFIGFMKWVNCEADDAYTYLSKAESMDGPESMRNNIRSIKLLAAFNKRNKPANFDDLFITEYKRLYEESVGAYKLRYAQYEKGNDEVYDNRISDWIIFSHEMYDAASTYYMPTSVVPLILYAINERYNYENIEDNKNWRIVSLDNKAKTQELVDLLNAKRNGGNNKVEKELFKLIKNDDVLDENMLNELIGTKYLREQNFNEAKNYLSKVSLQYMSNLSIAPYLGRRKMPQKEFFRTQRKTYWDDDKYNLQRNVKLDFAETMIRLKAKCMSESGEMKAKTAYDIAHHLYQASPTGDLWAITEYRWSNYCSLSQMNQSAIEMLRTAIQFAQSNETKKKAYFGLIAASTDNDNCVEWNYDKLTWSFNSINSTQKEAYNHLMNLVSVNDNIYRSCDVVRTYIKKNKRTSQTRPSTSSSRTTSNTRTSSNTRTTSNSRTTSSSSSTNRTRPSTNGSRTHSSR